MQHKGYKEPTVAGSAIPVSSPAPLISVVIPVYQSAGTIENVLSSILTQTFQNWETILINDGSTDASEKIILKFCEDKRIRMLNQAHTGVSAARNAGIKEANGEYLLFCDADDEYLPDAFQRLSAFAADQNDMTIFGATVHNLGCEFTLPDIVPEQKTYRGDTVCALFETGARPFVWNCLYRRQFLEQNRLAFREDFVLGEDQIFQISAILSAQTVRFVPEQFYQYNFGGDNTCNLKFLRRQQERLKEHLRITNAVYEIFSDKYGKNGVPDEFYRWVLDFLANDFLALSGKTFRALRQTAKETMRNIGKPSKKFPFAGKIKLKTVSNGFYRSIYKILRAVLSPFLFFRRRVLRHS